MPADMRGENWEQIQKLKAQLEALQKKRAELKEASTTTDDADIDTRVGSASGGGPVLQLAWAQPQR